MIVFICIWYISKILDIFHKYLPQVILRNMSNGETCHMHSTYGTFPGLETTLDLCCEGLFPSSNANSL